MKTFKELLEKTTELDEAGGFSYGAKPARKGSVAYNAMMKRKEQEKNQKTIEPKDQMVGTAKVVKEENQYMSKIEGGKGKGKGFGDKRTTVDDHLSAMNYHSGEYQKAMKEKRDSDARHHGMKYHKHKDQIERLGDVGNYRKESVELDEAKSAADYEAIAKKHVADGQKGTRANMVYASKMAGRARRAAEILKKGGSQEDAFKHYQGNVSEENELDEVNVMNRTSPVKRGNYVHSNNSATPGKDSGTHNVVDAAGKVVASYKNKMDAIDHANKKDEYRVKSIYEEAELDEAKTPEQKLQDIRDAIGLAREKRKMKGQRVQSQREIDLQKKHDDLSQQIRSKSVVEELDESNSEWGNYTVHTSTGKHTVYGPGTDHEEMRKHLHRQGGGQGAKTYGDIKKIEPYTDKVAATRDTKSNRSYNEAVDFHAQAMEHKKQSDAAMDKNDMEAYHHHMSAHHEAMGQWHESKGRSSSADKEYEKAEKHHELSLKKSNQKNEGTDMLSFKYFQEVLEEAKKKCKESSSELENAHDMKDMEDELDDEEKDELEEAINEVLSKDATAGDWISDFVHSDNPKFAGKTKEKRKQMALAAYYAKQRNEEVDLEEQAPVAPAPGMKDGKYAIMVHPESKQRVTIERKNKKNYPEHEGWKEVGLGMKLKEEVEELDEAAITHIVAKKDLASHKEWMDSEGFDTETKPLPKSHPKHATHVGIVSKDSTESQYHEDGHAISESVELDERNKENALKRKSMDASRGSRFKLQGNPVPEPEAGHKTAQAHNKAIGRAIRQMTREEYEMIDEISTATMGHAGKTTLKHIKNPGVQLRMAAHDVKPGIKGYRDRVALLKAADAEDKLKESVDEAASPFDWKAYAKERGTAAGEKTKTFHDVKKTSTGTVYTKQVNPDGMSKGSGDDAAKEVEKAEAPKRGRGRPAGVGAKTGSYKPRDPEKKAASAAKAAASKAANRAMRKESFDEEFMGSLIEGFEDEDFDDFLYCEEFDELDEATQEALINFINEKCASKMKESLTGNQHKLDKNKNGKIDSHDFKLLRKEETEQLKESVTSYAAFLNKK